MEYKIPLEDIRECFEFAVKYHLHPKKSSSTRTSGQARGLGEVIDSFLGGKLVEIGVARMIESVSTDKKCILDLEIKDNNLVTNEPDIVGIEENRTRRDPNLFIEIKRTSSEDRWVGLTLEQYQTIKTRENNPEKIFIVGASIYVGGSGYEKQNDLLGGYLRKATGLEIFKDFTDVENCRIKLDYIISGKELEEYNTNFGKNDFFYETNLFVEASALTSKQIRTGNTNFEEIGDIENATLPPYAPKEKLKLAGDKEIDYPVPQIFFPLKVTGKITLYKKQNPESERRYLYCHTDTIVESEVVGRFSLLKDKFYEYNISTIGRNPVLARNNIWIARNKVCLLQEENKIKAPDSALTEVATRI